MAEFLVKISDNTHHDSIKDARGCYKRGDIVEVYDDGRCTEAPSVDSKFYIIKMPGLSGVKDHCNPVLNLSITDKLEFKNRITMRRKWKFDLDALSMAEKDELLTSRWITIDKSRHDALCIDKEA